ncbi:MAG: glycosyl hydrolase, partial [Bacteroidetes bacterium]
IVFPVKDALMYVQDGHRYGEGSAVYHAKNPPFGATFTYYVKEVPKTLKQKRLKKEKELFKNGDPIPQPAKEELDNEKNEIGPYFVFTIKNDKGTIVRRLYKKAAKGMGKMTWNLRYMNPSPVKLKKDKFNPTKNADDGMFALPGDYTVEILMVHNDDETHLAGPVKFTAKVLNNTTLPAQDRKALDTFYKDIADLWRISRGTQEYLDELQKKAAYIQQAIQFTNLSTPEMRITADNLSKELEDVAFIFNGTPAKASTEEVPPEKVSLNDRLSEAVWTSWGNTSAPTATQLQNVRIIRDEIPAIQTRIEKVAAGLKTLESQLDEMKAPYTPGRMPK